MNMDSRSIIYFNKPVNHLGINDWTSHCEDLQQAAITKQKNAFEIRHQARQIRNEARIETDWTSYQNNIRLSDRISEVERWHVTLIQHLKRVESFIQQLKEDKEITEKVIISMSETPTRVVSECMAVRDSRLHSEITYDDVDRELQKEFCVLENICKLLSQQCQEAWNQTNKLVEVRNKLMVDIEHKYEALQVDKSMLDLDADCGSVSYKLEPLRIHSRAIPYETWIDNCNLNVQRANKEVEDTLKLMEIMFASRESCRNDLWAQQQKTDYALRLRIHATNQLRNEMQYQENNLKEEMERVTDAIPPLEVELKEKKKTMQLYATRLEGRYFRPGLELVKDDTEFGLQDGYQQVQNAINDIQNKIDATKSILNVLEEHLKKIQRDLSNKENTFMLDIRCVDIRKKIEGDLYGNIPKKQTKMARNIELFALESEMPPN